MSRVGLYSRSDKSWFAEDAVQKTSRRSPAPNKRPVVSVPVFNELAEAISDIYWQNHFRDFARGSLPSAFSYDASTRTLTYRKKNAKPITATLPDDVIEAANVARKFFLAYAGMCSQRDRAEIESESVPTVRHSKKRVNDLVTRYASRASEQMGLTPEQTAKLRTLIRTALICKQIGKQDFVIGPQEETITIQGLHRDPSTGEFYVKSTKPRRRTSSRQCGSSTPPMVQWHDFLKSLRSSQMPVSIRIGRNCETTEPDTPDDCSATSEV